MQIVSGLQAHCRPRQLNTGSDFYNLHLCPAVRVSPVEILLAVDLAVSGEALVVENQATVDTPDTVRVPGPLQDGEDVLVEDGFVTGGADHEHGCGVVLSECSGHDGGLD